MKSDEICALADRLHARASSMLTEERKCQRSDLERAAELLRNYAYSQQKKESEQPFAKMPVV